MTDRWAVFRSGGEKMLDICRGKNMVGRVSRAPDLDLEHSESILLVDDDDLLVRGLVRQLRGLGYPLVYRAASAREAVELLSRMRPSVVFTDMAMEAPDAGRSVVDAARRQGIPVAVVSGRTDLTDESLGAPVFRKGTLDAAALVALIHELTHRAQTSSQPVLSRNVVVASRAQCVA